MPIRAWHNYVPTDCVIFCSSRICDRALVLHLRNKFACISPWNAKHLTNTSISSEFNSTELYPCVATWAACRNISHPHWMWSDNTCHHMSQRKPFLSTLSQGTGWGLHYFQHGLGTFATQRHRSSNSCFHPSSHWHDKHGNFSKVCTIICHLLYKEHFINDFAKWFCKTGHNRFICFQQQAFCRYQCPW